MNRILLTDKDEALLSSYREHLLRDGFDVITATDGLDCVAKLRNFRPDVLVLEPDLHWGSGEDVLAMMYEERDVPLVPVMVLAERPGPRGRCGVGIFPVNAYHVKPLPPAVLAQSLQQLLRRKDLPRRRQVEAASGVVWDESANSSLGPPVVEILGHL